MTATFLSRNETESLCAKAARGAGLPWGLAEEAGWAAGWLARQGVDAAQAVLALLSDPGVSDAAPVWAAGQWQSADGRDLCPIRLGAALIDRGDAAAPDLRLGKVAQPVLLLPFLARLGGVIVQSGADRVVLAGGEPQEPAPVLALATMPRANLQISLAPPGDGQAASRRPALRPATTEATLRGLDALALRTTVPATAASRAGGAGAGTSDND